MRINKNEIPVRVDAPGATARQLPNFGDASGYGDIGAEYFSMAAGTDLAGLLEGLEGDACQSPHWGYLIDGEITVSYTSGEEETVSAGDMFYWPPGHSVRVGKDAEIVLFSPQHEHGLVIDHINSKLGA
ncbi:MAG: cupin domain-containing protein [Woeseiaceae bacterium]|nr:cupin domain-containing protein [Woeseiaceae bacterium]